MPDTFGSSKFLIVFDCFSRRHYWFVGRVVRRLRSERRESGVKVEGYNSLANLCCSSCDTKHCHPDAQVTTTVPSLVGSKQYRRPNIAALETYSYPQTVSSLGNLLEATEFPRHMPSCLSVSGVLAASLAVLGGQVLDSAVANLLSSEQIYQQCESLASLRDRPDGTSYAPDVIMR